MVLISFSHLSSIFPIELVFLQFRCYFLRMFFPRYITNGIQWIFSFHYRDPGTHARTHNQTKRSIILLSLWMEKRLQDKCFIHLQRQIEMPIISLDPMLFRIERMEACMLTCYLTPNSCKKITFVRVLFIRDAKCMWFDTMARNLFLFIHLELSFVWDSGARYYSQLW